MDEETNEPDQSQPKPETVAPSRLNDPYLGDSEQKDKKPNNETR
jgi:hypothetical protein